MRILTDLDGVVLDWFSAFKKYVVSLGIPQKCDEPTDWNLDSWIEHRNINKLVETFNNTDAFGNLDPYQDAINVIPELHYKHGYPFHAITASSKTVLSMALREVNLDKRFGTIFRQKNLNFVGLGETKLELLKGFEPALWIEDRPKAALEGLEAGHTCLLMDRPHNRKFSHPQIRRVKDWYDICDLVSSYNFRCAVEKQT